MEAREAALPTEELPMNPYRRPALHEAYRVRDAVLGRDAQQQMHVIRHRVALHQLDVVLHVQLPQDASDLLRR